MQPVSSYGLWLRHRVNTELHRLQSGQTFSGKWSYTAIAGVLSALLVIMAFFSIRGEPAYDSERSLRQDSSGRGLTTGAWTLPRIDAKNEQKTFDRPDPSSDDWDNTVAICAMMTDAQPDDVLEWLQYHKWLGVDKVFIRENKSNMHVEHAQKFQEMVNSGFLDIGYWQGEPPEATLHWYNRCSYNDLAGASSWVLFANLDQYMVLMNEGVALQDPDLKAFLRKRKGLSGMQLHRVLFGSSNLVQRPSPGGPLEHYTKCKDLFSFPSKCFMSSFHMCSTPFPDTDDLDACAYRTQKGPEDAYKVDVEYGDAGSPWDLQWAVVSTHIARKAQPHLKDHEGEQCVGFERKLHDPGWGHSPRDVGKGEALVLFHYVTRSYEEFMDREPTLPGVYSDKFKERWEASRAARSEATGGSETGQTDAEVEAKAAFDEFESRHTFNFEGPDHPVCSSIVAADYPNRCCRS